MRETIDVDGLITPLNAIGLSGSVVPARFRVPGFPRSGKFRMSTIVRRCFERWMAVSKFGMAMAAMMPMIATTTSSSIRVKPFSLRITLTFP